MNDSNIVGWRLCKKMFPAPAAPAGRLRWRGECSFPRQLFQVRCGLRIRIVVGGGGGWELLGFAASIVPFSVYCFLHPRARGFIV